MDDPDVLQLESCLNKVIEDGEKLLQDIQAVKTESDVDRRTIAGIHIESKYQKLKSSVAEVGDAFQKSTPKKTDASDSNDTEALVYELKAQMMKNLDAQNGKLRTELSLHEKLNEVRLLHQENKRLRTECSVARANAIKVTKMFERKAIAANDKLSEMQTKLESYEKIIKHQKNSSEAVDPSEVIDNTTNHADSSLPNSVSTLKQSCDKTEFVSKPKKNEAEENRKLQQEVKRLKEQNDDLTRRLKYAASNQHTILCNLNTSESCRTDLAKKLKKEKLQNERLTRSLTRKTADWVESRKTLQQFEEDFRWEQVGPIPTGGQQFRVPHLPTAKNLYMPRKEKSFAPIT